MKIGVLTFWWDTENYGQVLQCYALQKYLTSLGHDVFIIRYLPEGDLKNKSCLSRILKLLNPSCIKVFFKQKYTFFLKRREKNKHPRYFDVFKSKYINQSEEIFYSFEQLNSASFNVDMLVVGSDQVWNFWGLPLARCRNTVHAYFLNFGMSNVKRVSYAASWGVKTIKEDFVNEIKPLLKKFDWVSVREKSGIKICGQCGREDVEWICDPTLLLNKSDYQDLIGKTSQNKENPYLFLYILGNEYSFSIRDIYSWGREKRLDIKYVTANDQFDKYAKCYPSIEEWIGLIAGAEYVITNSFHCAIFAIIFDKKFACIPLTGQHSGMNERMYSLFELFQMESHFIENGNFSILENEYNLSEKYLDRIRHRMGDIFSSF